MSRSATEKNLDAIARRDRLNGGKLELLAADGTIVATAALGNPCGTVAGSVTTFTGMPIAATIANYGVPIASARLRTSANVDVGTGYTVGTSGSGAQVIVSKLTPVVGDTLTLNSLTHTET